MATTEGMAFSTIADTSSVAPSLLPAVLPVADSLVAVFVRFGMTSAAALLSADATLFFGATARLTVPIVTPATAPKTSAQAAAVPSFFARPLPFFGSSGAPATFPAFRSETVL